MEPSERLYVDMNQDAKPLKYLPLIGMVIIVVFWGASQVVQAYAEPARHRAGERAGMGRTVPCAQPTVGCPARAARGLTAGQV